MWLQFQTLFFGKKIWLSFFVFLFSFHESQCFTFAWLDKAFISVKAKMEKNKNRKTKKDKKRKKSLFAKTFQNISLLSFIGVTNGNCLFSNIPHLEVSHCHFCINLVWGKNLWMCSLCFFGTCEYCLNKKYTSSEGLGKSLCVWVCVCARKSVCWVWVCGWVCILGKFSWEH